MIHSIDIKCTATTDDEVQELTDALIFVLVERGISLEGMKISSYDGKDD